MERNFDLEAAMENRAHGQLARMLALVGQGTSARTLGPEAGMLEAITGSPKHRGGRMGSGEEATQGECVNCFSPTVTRCEECGAWCHENCRAEQSCAFCKTRNPEAAVAYECVAYPARRTGRLTSALEPERSDGERARLLEVAAIAFFAGFVCCFFCWLITGGVR